MKHLKFKCMLHRAKGSTRGHLVFMLENGYFKESRCESYGIPDFFLARSGYSMTGYSMTLLSCIPPWFLLLNNISVVKKGYLPSVQLLVFHTTLQIIRTPKCRSFLSLFQSCQLFNTNHCLVWYFKALLPSDFLGLQ